MLYRIRNSALASCTSVLTVLCVLALSISACSESPSPVQNDRKGTVDSKTNSTTKYVKYDGETLFNGLFFNKGEAADKFSMIWSDENYGEIYKRGDRSSSFKNKLADWMKKNHPNFFEKFKSGITSGNQITIQNTLDNARNKIEASLPEITDITKEELKSMDKNLIENYEGPHSKPRKNGVIATPIAVVQVIFIWLWIPPLSLDTPSDSELRTITKETPDLKREEVINQIAQTDFAS